jgi:hypothetical protein
MQTSAAKVISISTAIPATQEPTATMCAPAASECTPISRGKKYRAKKLSARRKDAPAIKDWSAVDDTTLIRAMIGAPSVSRDLAYQEFLNRFEPAINKRIRKVLAKCPRWLRASDMSQDIKGDVFAALLTNDMARLRLFDESKGTLVNWLLRITKQQAWKHIHHWTRHGVPAPLDEVTYHDVHDGYGEEDHDREGDGQIGARWIALAPL